MNIFLDPYFLKNYKKLISKNPSLRQIIKNKIKLFEENPLHPSLRIHKLSGKQEQWSIGIKSDLRIVFQYIDNGILLVNIGSHNQVY